MMIAFSICYLGVCAGGILLCHHDSENESIWYIESHRNADCLSGGSVTLQVLVLSVGSLVLSVLLVRLFESVLPSSMPFQLGFSTFALTCVLFVLMSMAGSLFSVWKVAKIDALDAIGRTAA